MAEVATGFKNWTLTVDGSKSGPSGMEDTTPVNYLREQFRFGALVGKNLKRENGLWT